MGRPADAAEFWFAEDDPEGAGVLDTSAHGLRKAAAIRAADDGATAHELMATLGWIDIKKAEI